VVSDEVTTFDARVVPVNEPAGAEPEMFPVTLPVNVPVKLPVPLVKKRLVVEAVVVKKLVEVLLVVVEFNPVKFWRVVEPVCKVFEKVVWPAVTLRVPVKEAAFEIVWPLIKPAVIAVAKRLVEEAVVENKVVAKKLVEVLFVVVELVPVKS